MIDIHNHIIPGIDDGATDMSMALAMLQMAQEQGVQRLVCTPHMHAGRFDNNQSTIKPAFAALQQAASDAELTIELAMGAEVRISDEFMVQLIRGQVPFIGRWQEKRALLLDMPHDSIPVGMSSLLRWLAQQNIQRSLLIRSVTKRLCLRPRVPFPWGNRERCFRLRRVQ